MSSQLQRAINLAKKTGDKLIVFDSREPENSYVLIPFAEYEREVYGNSDFSEMDDDYEDDDDFSWVEEKADNSDFNNDYEGENDFPIPTDNHLTEEERIDKINRDLSISKEENLSTGDDFDKMNFLEGNFDRHTDFSEEPSGKRGHWSIPKNIKEVAEEVIEEDRHYLEEITF